MPQISGSYVPQISGSQPLKLKKPTNQWIFYQILKPHKSVDILSNFRNVKSLCANVIRPC